ncbi:hypothetical protein [Bordetella sp. N]|uniref:hypothetical protein n=1 Tax=Bordetella sp. N TaxID=1746199 RepID=UPI00070BB44E|nr:hypothetical protein [Bordetella sp. N]ALM83410.1 hypothetical protein ASB57_10935 [Bordetella sp. N]
MRHIPSFARHTPWAARALFALRALRARRLRDPDQYVRVPSPWQPLHYAVAATPRRGRHLSLLVCRPATVDLH